ncbi:Phage tail sheath protein FI [hydrothermal vent metagenome]|uniref:Phage tail sheath protein FI n=1 Tax=hydrothermal vent metagenome TaxID=652676 RepID=A0A3B0URN7_9ZZZZ
MATYLAPGVYVEEVPSAVKPIAGVGTSTAGFVGVVANSVKMPLRPGAPDKPKAADYYTVAAALAPQPVNSWGEFEQKFGEIQDANQYLAQAVYGFYNNGGGRCWVTRVAAATKADDVAKAIDTFEAIDEIGIVAAPLPPTTAQADLNAIQNKLLTHCQLMQDRVAILDSARDIATDNLVITTDDKGIWAPGDSGNKGYGAFYFPWIEVSNPAGGRIVVPPSGHLAGIYARSDAQRGVHKAPANEGVMGALGVKYRVSKILQGSLNPSGVNVIRPFGSTIKVWGARTMATDPEWTYVSTRRLFNFLRESIDEGTQWVVFEPNTPDLWAKIRRNITAFLTTTWESGALFGNTAAEAFFVRCDASTNPPAVRDLGQVVTEIGVSVIKPAEFVVFRLSQWAGPGE